MLNYLYGSKQQVNYKRFCTIR